MFLCHFKHRYELDCFFPLGYTIMLPLTNKSLIIRYPEVTATVADISSSNTWSVCSLYLSPSYHVQGWSAGPQLVHFQHHSQQCIDRTPHPISQDPKLEDYVPSEEEKHKYNFMIQLINISSKSQEHVF